MVTGDGHDAFQDVVRDDVSAGYLIAMDDPEDVRFEWPEHPDCFIVVKATSPKQEDRIARATVQIAVGNKKSGTMQFGPNEAFVEKCVEQIVDFAVPVSVKGEASVLRYDGDRRKNRAFYEKLCMSEMRTWVEAKLDEVAGRDIPTQEDLAGLGEE